MHRLIFGHSFAKLVAPILLLGLSSFYFLNKKKANAHGNAGNSDTSACDSLTTPTETNSSVSSSTPIETTNGASSSSTESSGNYYDVFLSFSGKDTRNNFTDHLYHKLVDTGISTFRDNNELHQGKKISPDLFAAIENSKISIPILSVNYGTSKWCLNELVRMMECQYKTEHIVLPIFYNVEPSDVRRQTGDFGDAFLEYERRLLHKGFDPKWKKALNDVSDLKGWLVTGPEGELVKSVVEEVTSRLIEKFELDTPENLIGIDSHVEKIMEFIANNSHVPLFVGIHGMGGIGKTTIAKTIYNKLLKEFKYHSFIANIREKYKYSVEYVQEQLIYDILRKEIAPNKDLGIKILSSIFKNKKVLILLDDVDQYDQLNDSVRSHNWFSPGSVIIITTRDGSILDRANVNLKHEHNGLDRGSSLILFCRHAFLKDKPLSGFEELTNEVVSTTGGLPLSLKVIGSLLRTKEQGVWEDTIRQLQKVPNKEVQDTLQISYDALEREEKHIFLDIACFFIGTDWRIASYMWDACDFYPKKGIDVLKSRSLIKVGENHELIMHDQLRDLGRDIVRKEDVEEPKNRSRLWDSKEISTMLEEDEGTRMIKALCLPMGETYTAEKFKELTKLRFLQANGASLTGDFQNLLSQLRWLEWTSCCLDLEAAIFCPKKLIILDLSNGKIKEDWGGWDPLKMATELKVLNLMYCTLRTIPDLSAFKSLEILNLEYCKHLEEIHPSIEGLKTLVSLNVGSCQNLEELPRGVGRMEALRELRIDDTMIQEIPISRGCLTKLDTLDASYCPLLAQLPESLGSLVSLTKLHLVNTRIEELPESVGSLKKLKKLDASYCASLAHIPSSIGDLASLSLLDLTECDKLAQLPGSIGSLVSLQRLLLSRCSSLGALPDSIGQLESLTELHLKSTAIKELPKSIGSLKKLKTLDVSCCASLAHIPSSIGNLASLSLLDLTGCDKLAQLPSSIGSLMSLQCLLLSGCSSLGAIPDSIGQLESLTKLHLKSTGIEELPKSIGSLKKLKTLDASYCESLAQIPSSIGNLASLSLLDLTGCDKLAQLPGSISSLVSLQCLLLSRCHSLREIPNSIGKLSLTKLYFSSTTIMELREGIGNTQNLRMLNNRRIHITELVDDRGILAELPDLRALGAKIPEGLPSNTDLLNRPLKRSRTTTTNNSAMDHQTTDTDSKLVWKRSRPFGISDEPSAITIFGSGNATAGASMGYRGASVAAMVGLNSESMADVKPRIADKSRGKSRIWKLTEINQPLQCQSKRLPNILTATRVSRLTYSNSGHAIQALSSNGLHRFWEWQKENANFEGRATISVELKLRQPPAWNWMTNDTSDTNPEDAVPCSALSMIDLLSASGGTIFWSDVISSAANRFPEAILRGHQKRITGLTFSGVLNVLVSSGADSQLCVWSTDGLEKRASKFLQMLPGRGAAPPADTRVQFHVDQIHLLVVHKTQIATYEAPDLKCLHQWVTREASSPITDATFSCNGQSIYVSFEDGSIGVLTTSKFRLRCRINPAAYIPPNPSLRVYPLIIAAHPWDPNEFALALTDGSVYVLEPLGSEGKWGTPPPVKNGAGPSTTTKRNRSRSTRKVNNLPINILPVTYKNQSHGQSSYSSDDLPKNVVMTLNQDSPIKSMDFHPERQILLLVGTNMGDVMVWEVGNRARIALRNFKVWDLGSCSMALQACLANGYIASVNRVMWSPNGTLFGVAYSEHMVHIYSYHGGDDIRNHLEIDAHVGSVNDLAFSYPNNQLCVVTCGDDRFIKVWDAVTGAKQHILEGHEAPVCSICPRCKENAQFIYSASTDGKIKAWLYDDKGPRVDYDAPGRSSVAMAFSVDRTRLFSHGTNIEGESYLVEWNEGMWTIRRWYCGLRRRLGRIGQFDISKNGFLAAGDECMVKFWDMDNTNILTTTDAEGGLPASPCIKFNKEGTLLAVSTIDNDIKILANSDGIMQLRTVENRLL